ncbi:cytochrome b6 [Desulfuromonas versatilis]|uniref:Cytochrome b6 n=1 Tax=Desulfuromonas versatilis TaxID=2802975 RepID=A0ABN6DVH4_9BACT|nr:ubiquinol-cytochrome c reductase iron-sulfur subunit [Desulfuromonas versatilis]BCR04143.1 cytochrome b6 [Desulfuromonas versatilis]
MDNNPISPSQRRGFLITILAGLGTAVTAVTLWPMWRFLAPRKGPGALERVAVARASVDLGAAHFFNFRGAPAVLLQPSPGNFAAFSAVCPHLGCIIKWQQDKGEFLCPCHAGRFSADGKVLGGPPPKPLESIPVALEGDQIMVG